MEVLKEKVKFQEYPAYKDSGIEWVGEIPEHWEIKRLGSLLNPISTKNKSELPLLSITREKGVIKRNIEDEDENHNYIPDDLSGYKVLKKGQFGMNKMKAWQGSYGISKYTGIVSPAYYVFDFFYEVDPEFFNIAIRSKKYISFFGSASDGVRIGQWDLSKSRMKSIPFLLPPVEEQTAIASFLDEKCDKIDTAIEQKQKLIELLKERKQIIIQELVTGKKVWNKEKNAWTEPAEVKDSGVEWIGEIPEHWEVRNLRYSFHFLNYKRIPLSAIEREKMQGKYPYYGASGIIDYVDDYIFNEKLILIAEDGANLLSKSTPLAFTAEGKYWVNNHAHILRPKNSGFLYWAEQLSLIDYTTVISGAAQPKLSRENLGSVKTIVPPKTEIEKIEEYIEEKSVKINESLLLQQQQIEKLKEYKSSLIDAAVTGKIKVTKD
jgi:type I restriction enzyme S subunit